MTDPAPVATAPRFIGEAGARAKTIPLAWPLEFGGKEFHAISIVRLTAGDVAAYSERLEELLKSDPKARVRFPMFRDERGDPVPDAVLDALDDDDRFAIEEAMVDFLPRRFRAAAPDSTPATGATIAP